MKAVGFLSLENQRQKDIFGTSKYIKVKHLKDLSSSGKYWHSNKYTHVKKTGIVPKVCAA